MSNRDYANRKPKASPARAKGARAKNKGPHRTMGQIPLIPTILVFILVGGFGYFLWSIKDSAKDLVSPAKEVVQPVTKPAKKDPNALPPKPQEEWTYLEELENKNVEVDLPSASNEPTKPYQMQCGSFRKQAQADEMKAVIAFQGLEAQVRKVEGNSGVWYKVVLGPYPRKREAERQRHKLQNAGINGCQIWLWES